MPFLSTLESARGGSGPALGTILESCRGYITVVAVRKLPRRVQGRVSPSSLVQETYLRACANFTRFRGQSERQLLAWLRQIMLHCLMNLLRQRESRTAHTGLPANLADRSIVPDRQAADAEFTGALMRAIDRLPLHYRLAIELRHFDRLGFEEIGAILGCSSEAARKVWARAQTRLGKELESFQ